MLTRKKVLLSILMVIVMLMTVACSTINNSNKPQNEDTSFDVIYHNQKIENVNISEGWLENNVSDNTLNLSDTDKVNVIIEVEGESLLDRYLSQSTYAEMKDYAISAEGDKAVRELTEIQNNVKELIDVLEYEIDYGFSYTSLFNGFSATINYGDVEKLEKLQGVDRVVVCEEYAVPDAIDVNKIEESMQQTGLFTNDTEYQGEGMLIAVLDTGLDYNHPAFNFDIENPAINKEYINNLTASLYANRDSIKFDADKLYFSTKIPFQFDYANFDNDVMPHPMIVNLYGGYHGTHVAGIIGAYNEDGNVIGAAYNAQLAIMKVFPDSDRGAATDSIIAALSDCAILGVDVINMSLGTPAGFSYERYEDLFYVNKMYQLLDKLGISVIVSAGNSYSQAIINKKGATDPSNPDSGFVGSPSTYCSSVTIASIDAYQTSWFLSNETEKVYMKSAVKPDSSSHNCEEMILNGNDSYTFDIVPVPNAGEESDYNGLDVTGKTVLVQRGGISFEEKQKIAAKFGAKACIIYNNEERKLFGAQVNELVIPTFTILMEDGIKLVTEYAENNKAELKLNSFSSNYSMSDFSSWGCGSDLTLKPEISAPGGNIYSTMPQSFAQGKYGYLSGTSMAAPNFAAVNAVVRQYIKENFPSLTNKEIRTLSYQLLMSTANLAVDDYGVIVSPRKQGAGVADVNAAVNTKAYLTVTGSDRTKLELGDDKNRDGIYTLDFNLVNFDTRALSYDINAIVMTETVVNGLTAERGHLFTDRKLNISVKNAAINGTVVTVEAGNTAKLTITITLTEEEKAYLDELFVNGMYVEGFATLKAIEEDSEDLSIPFLAFYGDWTDAPIFDKTLYDNEEAFITHIYVNGNYRFGCRMGDYQWQLPDGYEKPAPSYAKISLSNSNGANNIILSVVLPMLRNATELYYRIYDPINEIDYYNAYGFNIRKSFWVNGQINITQHGLNINANEFDWLNNQNLIMEITAALDYDGRNKTQKLEFPLKIDSESPTLINSTLRQENDKYYIDAEIYDNYHLSQVFISTLNKDNEISPLDIPLPIYDNNWVNSTTNKLIFDITPYIEKFNEGKVAIILEDTAYNQSSYYLFDISEKENINAENQSNADNNYLSDYIKTESDEINYESIDIVNEELITQSTNTEHTFIIANGKLISYSGPGGEIIIPENVTIIGEGVFQKNATISKVKLSDAVESIERYAFDHCINLEEIELSNSLKTIGYRAFRCCMKLKNIDFEKTQISLINSDAFYGCISLEKLHISGTSDLVKIGANAFEVLPKCTSIEFFTNVELYPGFNIIPNCKKIIFHKYLKFKSFGNAFLGLNSLESIEFRGDVDKLGNGSNVAMFSSNPVKKVEFFGNIEGITSMVFNNCTELEEVIFHGYIKQINRLYAFGNTKFEQFTISDDNKYMSIDPETGIMYYNNDRSYMMMPSLWDYDGIFVLPESVVQLQPAQFSHCANLVQVSCEIFQSDKSVGSAVTTLKGVYSEPKTKLKGIKLHDKITEIPDFCFHDNTNLVSIENIENVTKVGQYAFARCSNLTEINLNHVNNLGNYLFKECKSLKQFIYPDAIKNVGSDMFWGCESLEYVNIKNAKSIYSFAFMDCKSLKTVDSNMLVESISSNAFKNCNNLETLNIGDKLKSLSSNVFENCYKLKSIIIPETVKTIGTAIFKNCNSLENIVFSSNIKKIPKEAFYNCQSLKNFVFSNSIIEIGEYAFAKSGLNEIILPESIVQFDLLTSFAECSNLTKFEVPETCLFAASKDGVLYSKDYSEVFIYPSAKIDEKYILNDSVKNIGNGAFANTKYLKELHSNSVKEIGNNAFINSSIEILVAPSLKSIMYNAFSNSLISNIDLSNVEIIYDNAFNNCNKLIEINVKNTYEIGKYAFNNTLIKNIILPDNIQYIGSHAFANCKNLNSITIEKNCANFDYAFVFENSPITNINIENGNKNFVLEDGILYNGAKTIIHDYIGSGTGKLSIAEGIIKISAYAFANSNFSEVELPESLEIISDKAFYGTENLRTFIFNSQKAPKLESRYEEERVYCYNNFVDYIENIVANKMELTMYHPADTSYHDYIYEMYFANRYEESEEGYIKLNVKVSDVNNMMKEVVNGNTALIAEASKLYSMMTETQKSCVNNSEMLNINDMALAVKANDNVYIVIAALFSSLVAFVVIATKRK